MEDVFLIYFDPNFSFCAIIYSRCFVKTLAWIRQISQKGYFFAIALKNTLIRVPFVTNSASVAILFFFWKSHVWGLRHLSPVVPIVSDCWLCNLACFVVFKDPRHRGLFFSHFENLSLCGVVKLWARGLPLFMILIFDFETFYWSGVRMHMYIIDFDCIFLFQSL